MRTSKIGVIMKQDYLRSNMAIALQKNGYRVYMVPEDKDIYETMKKMELELILLGEAKENSFLGYIEGIKNQPELAEIPIIAILHKNMQQSDMVNILKNGATDIIYIKNNNINPVLTIVDKFLNETRAEFNLETIKIFNTVVLKVIGELDITNSFHFKKHFNDMVQSGDKNFVIDIGSIDYLESVGLGVLIYMQKTVNKINGKLIFIIRSARILKLLEMVKLHKYFEIYENLEDVITLPQAPKKIKVIVIDDARFMRTLIRNILEEEDFEVIEFPNPKVALPEIEKYKPDIILVDYEMPEMDGMKFIETFKPLEKDIPTVMLTTVSDINLALKALRMGASDFLNKPFEKEELIHIIRKIIRENQLKKENERLVKELQKREKELEKKNHDLNVINKNMEEELEMASEIQLRLLPQRPPEIEGYAFAVRYKPSQDIGGDFYEFLKMSNGRFGIAFADVSGHGIPAALLSTMFKVFLTTYARDINSPAEAMEMINDVVVDSFPEGKFISTFYLIMEPNTPVIKYCKASQEPGLWVKNNGEVEEMITRGQVLGLFSTVDFPTLINFEEAEIILEYGEKIFLYTDGIIEAKNRKEEFYGLDRLKKMISENRELPINNLLEKVYGDLLDFLEGMPLLDDLTLLGIERLKEKNVV